MTRLLHFTDLHLRCRQPGTVKNPLRLCRDMPEVLNRFTGRIKEFQPDVLVMSGDVLDIPDEVITGGTPDERSHDEWMDYVKSDYRLVWDWFEATNVIYVVIPGNHDHEGAFADAFGGPPEPSDLAGLRFFCFWDKQVDIRLPQRTGGQKKLFEKAVTDAEHDCPQAHVQHYMIDPPTFAKGQRYDYEDSRDMKKDAERSGRVRATLSGHYHPGSLVKENGIVHSVPPAFCEALHPFRLYDIADGSVVVSDQFLNP